MSIQAPAVHQVTAHDLYGKHHTATAQARYTLHYQSAGRFQLIETFSDGSRLHVAIIDSGAAGWIVRRPSILGSPPETLGQYRGLQGAVNRALRTEAP